jgi:hypothetical protein
LKKIYLESVSEWFRFTDTPVGTGLLAIPVGPRNITVLLGFLNERLDEREFSRLNSLDKEAHYEIRQTSFIPSIREINQWLETFDNPPKPSKLKASITSE